MSRPSRKSVGVVNIGAMATLCRMPTTLQRMGTMRLHRRTLTLHPRTNSYALPPAVAEGDYSPADGDYGDYPQANGEYPANGEYGEYPPANGY